MASTLMSKGDKVMVAGGRAEVYGVVSGVTVDGQVTATQRGGTALVADARLVRRASPAEVTRYEAGAVAEGCA